MPVFPSKEWCEEAIRLLNADPEIALAGQGWTGDFGAVVDAEPGKLARPFVAHVVPKDGKVVKFRALTDPDDLDEFEPAYVVRAPYSVWKGLLLGQVDPVEAVLKRRIAVQGDVQPLIERMRYKGIADRVFAQLQTQFADEQGKR
jgi:putative sterol carrier protein